MIFASSAIAQNTGEGDEICRSVEDAQAETQRLKECELDRREIDLLKSQIENLKEKITLKDQESLIKDKMLQVKDEMIANQQRNFDQMKEIADRAIKLSEQGKRSTVQEILEWVIRIGLFAAGVFAAK